MAAGADELVPDSGGLTEHSKRWWNGHVKWDRNGYIDEKDGVFRRWGDRHDTPPPTPMPFSGCFEDDQLQDSREGVSFPVGSTLEHVLESGVATHYQGLSSGQAELRGGNTETLPPHLQNLRVLGEWAAEGFPSDHKLYEGLSEAEQSRVRGRLEGLRIGADVAIRNESLEKAYAQAGVEYPDAIWRASPLRMDSAATHESVQDQPVKSDRIDIRDVDKADAPESAHGASSQDHVIESHAREEDENAVVPAKSPFSWISDEDGLSDPPLNLTTPNYQPPSWYLAKETKIQDSTLPQLHKRSASRPVQDEATGKSDTKRKKQTNKKQPSKRVNAMITDKDDTTGVLAPPATLPVPAETLESGSNSEATTESSEKANGTQSVVSHPKPLVVTLLLQQITSEKPQKPATETIPRKDNDAEMRDATPHENNPAEPGVNGISNGAKEAGPTVAAAPPPKKPSTWGKDRGSKGGRAKGPGQGSKSRMKIKEPVNMSSLRRSGRARTS